MLLLSLTGILLIELNKRTFILYLSTLELIIYKYYIYIWFLKRTVTFRTVVLLSY